eukprot:8589259-Karenia_brevis.AAC.1
MYDLCGCTFDVGASNTIDNVKARINIEKGILTDQQYVIFADQQLRDGHTLPDYDILHGDTLLYEHASTALVDAHFMIAEVSWPLAALQ